MALRSEFKQFLPAADRLQNRYEDLQAKYRNELQSHSALKESFEAVSNTCSTERHQKEALAAENHTLKKKIKELQSAMVESSNPDISKRGQLEVQVETLQREKAELTKKLELVNGEMQYTREAYQSATQAATERTKEVDKLTTENAVLQRRASEIPVQLRQINDDGERERLRERLKTQQAALDAAHNRCRQLEEARGQAAYKGGRPLGTRASSSSRRASPVRSPAGSPALVGRDISGVGTTSDPKAKGAVARRAVANKNDTN